MSIITSWHRYMAGGYAAASHVRPTSPEECFYLALLAWSEQLVDQALHYMELATRAAPEHLVYSQAALYLERVQQSAAARVYASGERFTAFIRGGGNVPLYHATR